MGMGHFSEIGCALEAVFALWMRVEGREGLREGGRQGF